MFLMEMENYIAKLNEYGQRKGLMVNFEEVGSLGPDNIM